MSFVAESRFRPFYFRILMRVTVVSLAKHSARENWAMFYKQVISVNPATCSSISSVLTSFCRTHLQKKEGILAFVPQVILKENLISTYRRWQAINFRQLFCYREVLGYFLGKNSLPW